MVILFVADGLVMVTPFVSTRPASLLLPLLLLSLLLLFIIFISTFRPSLFLFLFVSFIPGPDSLILFIYFLHFWLEHFYLF